MRPVRVITTIVFAAAVAVAVTGSYIAYSTHAPQPPSDTSGPTSAALDRQAAVYAAVLRQFVTPGRDSFGYQGRFPRVFVLDRAAAGTGDATRKATPDGGELIPPAVRHAITDALADVAPLTFVASPAAAIDQQHPDRVRDEGILVTFGPLVGLGDRVQVGVDGFVSNIAATWLTYAVERTGSGWVMVGVTAHGPVA